MDRRIDLAVSILNFGGLNVLVEAIPVDYWSQLAVCLLDKKQPGIKALGLWVFHNLYLPVFYEQPNLLL